MGKVYDAVEKGDTDVLRALLTGGGGNPNDRCKDFRRTALTRAAGSDKIEAVKILLEAGADIWLRDYWNNTALFHAAAGGHHEVTQCLVEHLLREGYTVAVEKELKRAAAGANEKHAFKTYEFLVSKLQTNGWERHPEENQIIHVVEYPRAGRRITEVFNFEARERILISTNLNSGLEDTTIQRFDEVARELVEKAVEEFERQGGAEIDLKTLKSNYVSKEHVQLPGRKS